MEGCTDRSKPPGILRENFMFRYWKSKVAILQEVPEPFLRCDQYGMHIPAASILNTISWTSVIRRKGEDSDKGMWIWQRGVGK